MILNLQDVRLERSVSHEEDTAVTESKRTAVSCSSVSSVEEVEVFDVVEVVESYETLEEVLLLLLTLFLEKKN